ncbi:MAG: biopolymer transporter ExbD [Citrobacter freundii]|nr:MAG: biopolymer transporter ExbD [Citrobacter freundii]
MANISEPQVGRARSRSAAKLKRHSSRPDMTPMVDLGFLLIAFFVMTTEMSKPAVTKLNMPKVNNEKPPPLRESTALTFLIGGEKMYCYAGRYENAKANNEIYETNFSLKDGIGKIIRERQDWLEKSNITPEGRDGLVLLIKPGPNSNYQQVVDALDETLINGVTRYMIVSPDKEELEWMSKE